jgi:manganese oxidase
MRLVIVAALAAAILALCSNQAAAQTRTYYIAADEVVWNYAPAGRNVVDNLPIQRQSPAQLGWTYKKAVYREYTDATFTKLKPRPPNEGYLGILGPVIRAEVGDAIVVVFKNNAHLPYGVHAHGVFYLKGSEGAPYNDHKTPAQRLGDSVPPGGEHTYTWQVPERAGPGPNDPNSIVWMYHSHTDEVRDVNTGLFGPIIITAAGQLQPNGLPKGVDRELITAFAELEEDQSRYLKDNIRAHGQDPAKVKTAAGVFLAGNQFFTINGFLYGNGPMMSMHRGEHVRWYVLATMSDFDVHAPHWHGQTVLHNGMRTDTIELNFMDMQVADMTPDNVGIWLYHCHVNFHLQLGMSTRFEVLP